MKLLITLFATLFFTIQNISVEELRNEYSAVNQSAAKANKFISDTKNASSADAVSAGYKAAASFLAAKFEKAPAKRRALLVNGIRSLESLIKSNPNNTELRFIRFSIQENLPPIVGYFRNLPEDKKFLLKNYASQSPAVKDLIKNYAAHSRTMAASEKSALR